MRHYLPRVALLLLLLLLAGTACNPLMPEQPPDDYAEPVEGEGEPATTTEAEPTAANEVNPDDGTPPAATATPRPSPTRTRGNLPDLGGRTITVGIDPSYPPMEYLDPESGMGMGFDVDLMYEIGSRLNATIAFDTSRGYDTIFDGLFNNETEILVSSIAVVDNVAEHVAYSDPYIEVGQVMVVRRETTLVTTTADLPRAIVAVQPGTPGEQAAQQAGVPEAQLVRYTAIDQAFTALGVGEVHVVVCDSAPAAWFVSQFPDRLRIVGAPFAPMNRYAIVLRNDEREVQQAINAALREMQADGTLQTLLERWHLDQAATIPATP